MMTVEPAEEPGAWAKEAMKDAAVDKGNSERKTLNVRSLLFLVGELALLLATFWYATSGNFLALQQPPPNFAVKESNMKARSDMKTPDPVGLPTTPEFKTHQLSDFLIGKVRETGRKDPDPAETPEGKRRPLANLWKKIRGNKSKKGNPIRSIIERVKIQKTKAE
jgi:hypothetical protein